MAAVAVGGVPVSSEHPQHGGRKQKVDKQRTTCRTAFGFGGILLALALFGLISCLCSEACSWGHPWQLDQRHQSSPTVVGQSIKIALRLVGLAVGDW